MKKRRGRPPMKKQVETTKIVESKADTDLKDLVTKKQNILDKIFDLKSFNPPTNFFKLDVSIRIWRLFISLNRE